jgi:hypothetical protein
MNVGSLFSRPRAGDPIAANAPCELQGVAWDSGSGIARVEVSTDGGTSWNDAALEESLGPYSWRRWRSVWKPAQKGRATLAVRATSVKGETQGDKPRWNRAGYMKNDPERIDVEVT